jgi:hypothetical protein
MVAEGCGGAAECMSSPTILRRVRRPAVLLLLTALLLSSCGGGGDDSESVEDLLDNAFSTGMRSADLQLEAEVELKGLLRDPMRIEAEGPFRTNEGKLPSADIELKIGSDGGGQTITSGILTTGDRAFLKFQDVYYEQPPEQVRRANRAIRRGQRDRGRPLSELGLDPRSWLADAKDEGDADVAGVATRHVSGTLDVERLMRNLERFVRRSSAALGGDRASAPRLSEQDIREFADAVRDPSFDVYVGKRDGIIRRISGKVEFEIPERSRADLGGLEGGSITFSVELRDVNGDQEIEPPARARPLSELTETLGGGGIVGGLGGAEPAPSSPEDGAPSPEEEAFRSYEECLDKARPEDTEELQRCSDLLEQQEAP